MGRVIFYNPFKKDALTGGIKTTYYHTYLLNEMGIEAYIYAPEGEATWLDDKKLSGFVVPEMMLYQDDILVFPETLQPIIVACLERALPCRKIVFCQGAYLLLGFYEYSVRLKEWGVTDIAINSMHGMDLLKNVLGKNCPPMTLISPVIDKGLFYPESKEPIICSFGKKWRDFTDYEAFIQKMFHVKYPELSSIDWVFLENMLPQELAANMRKSMVCLSLSRLEGLGITALEAMASGAVVVGFHGGGGLDYARGDNGFWHSPEHLEDIVDSLAVAVRGYQQKEESVMLKVKKASETAEKYSIERVKKQLFEFYTGLLLGKKIL